MPNKLNPIMARFQDQPALIEEGRSAWLEACLNSVAAREAELEKMEIAARDDDDFWPERDDDYRSYYRPYKVKDGILHIPVRGVLLNNFPYALGGWATGYEYIWQAVKRGVEDGNVRGIALVIDSGGGMVAGNFDLVDRIYAVRGRKPIRAFANEHAYSAAYSIASVADDITVARTGGVGSIGVVVVHMEVSQMLADAGIKTTIIRSKPGKMEGNAYEALSEGARERIQERVDEFHNQFVALVARNRGMEAKAVDATNALTFMPQQAIDNGLADQIGNFDDAITAFVATFNSEGDETMADYTKAQYDEAVAAATEAGKAQGVTEGHAAGAAEGASTERARILAIVNSEEGKKRPAAAVELATDDDYLALKPEAVTKMLAKMPEESAQAATGGAPAGMLKDAMTAKTNQPGINAEVDDETASDDDEDTKRAKAARASVRL